MSSYAHLMDIPSKAVIDILTYLLPGFISSALRYNLTPAPRQIPFERIVEALIFTIIVQVLVLPVKEVMLWLGLHTLSLGTWTWNSHLTSSVMMSVLLGLFAAYAANSDKLHGVLRKLGITLQTSYPSEWFGAFSQNRGFVVLHLVGERRLYGWAHEWPSTPDRGHFVVMQAQWLTDKEPIELSSVDKIIVRAADVEMAELMKPVQPQTPEDIHGRSQTTDCSTP